MIAGIIHKIAPKAQILPVRVMNADGEGSLLDIAKGVDWAVANGARIINMSFGGVHKSDALNDALDRAEAKGVVLVASAGNDGGELKQFPAAGGKGTLAVGAVESNNVKAPYSNYGSFVRVVAPGTSIRSTNWDDGYANWSGTSFATPFVSGQAALLLSRKPTLTSSQVSDIIRSTARSVDGVNQRVKGRLGKGVINIEASLRAVR
jgi:subtilisin family serine protease